MGEINNNEAKFVKSPDVDARFVSWFPIQQKAFEEGRLVQAVAEWLQYLAEMSSRTSLKSTSIFFYQP